MDSRTRELFNISSLASIGGVKPQLLGHMHAALNMGVTKEEIAETLIMTAAHLGFSSFANFAKGDRLAGKLKTV